MWKAAFCLFFCFNFFLSELYTHDGAWTHDRKIESCEELHFVNHAAQHFFSEENGRPARRPRSLHCAFLLWVWLLFFLLLFELVQRGPTFLNVLVWGEALFGCFSVLRARSLSGGVSFNGMSTPVSSGYSHLHPVSLGHVRFSQDFRRILGEQLWMSIAWIASLGRKGLPSHTAL